MNCFKRIFSLGVTFAAAAALGCSAMAASAGMVNTDSGSLNVRSTASASSARVASLEKNSLVTLLSKNGSWWLVEYADGRYGYCHYDYISKLGSSFEGYVDIDSGSLNIRSSASKASSVKDRLQKNTQVVVLSEKNGWSRLLYNGTSVGYVASEYISQGKGYSDSGAVSLDVADYKQYDSRWANMKVGSSGKTMRAIGCVTAALAETERYRLGKSSVTPATMLKTLSYNYSGDVIWPSNYEKYTGSDYLGKTRSLLNEGKPVIFGAKKSNGKMHWVVVTGYNGGGLLAENFTINDPGSDERKTLDELFKEYPYFYKIEYYR